MSAVWRNIKLRINRWSQRWLRQRIPPTQKKTLDMRSIFILPSGFGLLYLLICVVLFLLGVNYQNNLVMGLSFFLFSVFNACILFAYRNLSGLTLTAVVPDLTQAEQLIDVQLHLESENDKFAIEIDSGLPEPCVVKHITGSANRVVVPFAGSHRGHYVLPRFKVFSHFPLGLCVCWSRVDLDLATWLYPKPIACRVDLAALNKAAFEGEMHQASTAGDDQFDTLVPYRLGESLNRIAWRHAASGRGLWQKSFTDNESPPLWLTDHLFREPSHDTVLGKLSYQAKLLSAQGVVFGFSLGEKTLPPDRGEQHCKQCLQYLAEEPTRW